MRAHIHIFFSSPSQSYEPPSVEAKPSRARRHRDHEEEEEDKREEEEEEEEAAADEEPSEPTEERAGEEEEEEEQTDSVTVSTSALSPEPDSYEARAAARRARRENKR